MRQSHYYRQRFALGVCCCLSFYFGLCGQEPAIQHRNTITSVDYYKISSSKRQEVLFFYENNWKVYRDIALTNGYISSYKLLLSLVDSAGNQHLMLMTEYSDSTAFALREERFRDIIKQTSPQGLRLPLGLSYKELRSYLTPVSSENYHTIAADSKK